MVIQGSSQARSQQDALISSVEPPVLEPVEDRILKQPVAHAVTSQPDMSPKKKKPVVSYVEPIDQKRYVTNIRFPNKDKIIYPLRPLLSLSIALFFTGLCLAGIISLPHAIYFVAIFTLDDVIFLPAMRIIKAARNLKHGRKSLKAWVSLIGVGIGAIVGALLGLLVVAKLATVVAFVPLVTSALGSSLAFFMLACIVGYKSITAFNEWAENSKSKMQDKAKWRALSWYKRIYEYLLNALRTVGRLCPDFVGIMVGAYVAEHFFPVIGGSVGLTMDVVMVTMLIGAFSMALLTRWAMQAYNRIRHWHSNADGYSYAIIEGQASTLAKDQAIADTFNAVHQQSAETAPKVTVPQVTRLRKLLIKIIRIIKDEALTLEDLWGIRSAKSGPFKEAKEAFLGIPKDSDPYIQKKLETPQERIANFQAILQCLQDHSVPLTDKIAKNSDPSIPLRKRRSQYAYTNIKKGAGKARAGVASLVGLETFARHVGRVPPDKFEGENMMRLMKHSQAQAGLEMCLPEMGLELAQASAPFLCSSLV